MNEQEEYITFKGIKTNIKRSTESSEKQLLYNISYFGYDYFKGLEHNGIKLKKELYDFIKTYFNK